MKIVLENFFSIDLVKEFYNQDNIVNSYLMNAININIQEEFFFERDFLSVFYFLVTENKGVTKVKELNNLLNFSSLLLIFKYHLTLDNSNMKEKKSKALFAQSDIWVVDKLKQIYDTFPINFFYEFLDTFGLSLELSLSNQAVSVENKYLEPYFLLLFKSLYYFDEQREMNELIYYADFIKDFYVFLMKGKKLSLDFSYNLFNKLIDEKKLKEVINYLEGFNGKH